MKQKISYKLDQAKKNLAKLEEELDNNENSVIAKRKHIVEFPIEDLLKKLQAGELNCIEVLKAYQAKVSCSHHLVTVNT